MAGYSGTPLAKKLGYKPGIRARWMDAPEHLAELLEPMPEGVVLDMAAERALDLLHVFCWEAERLARELPNWKNWIQEDGCIWVSWPKKSSKRPSSIHEDLIRTVALPLGLVDIKVCAVDETWSGLKLVIRKELRFS